MKKDGDNHTQWFVLNHKVQREIYTVPLKDLYFIADQQQVLRNYDKNVQNCVFYEICISLLFQKY